MHLHCSCSSDMLWVVGQCRLCAQAELLVWCHKGLSRCVYSTSILGHLAWSFRILQMAKRQSHRRFSRCSDLWCRKDKTCMAYMARQQSHKCSNKCHDSWCRKDKGASRPLQGVPAVFLVPRAGLLTSLWRQDGCRSWRDSQA